MTVEPAAGFTVGITAARRRDELAMALERRGARVVSGPAIRIVPLADDTQLLEATKRTLAGDVDLVIATTGIGFRGWLDAADTWGLGEQLLDSMGRATILARGPKARGAVRAGGLREAWSPESESSTEVLRYVLDNVPLSGRRVAVQLHGEPLPDLVQALTAAGADVIEVPVYRWVPPADEAPLRRLIDQVAGGSIDALAFTSAPAAVNFLRTADDAGVLDGVLGALHDQTVCVAVGPVTAAPLERAGVPVRQPARARLGALVREVVECLPPLAQRLSLAGHDVEIRGHAVVVDDRLVPLPATSMALLRALAVQPGHVLSREALMPALPGDSRDGHAVEVALGRLRTALGDPAMITTVVKRGYRLAVD
ncbi:MAG: uroporphyrinogen-III synthase [Jatrophihabitans sp.]|uniref:uroporphyrinogen-III synthase n=1 Tax=Jatrophihabitans sp. TaxID=1932789 RepID=UPI003F7F3C25